MQHPGCLLWRTSAEGKRRLTLNKSRSNKPLKPRSGPDERRQAGDTLLRTLKSGLKVGDARSEKELKVTYIKDSKKRKREHPIEEGPDPDAW